MIMGEPVKETDDSTQTADATQKDGIGLAESIQRAPFSGG